MGSLCLDCLSLLKFVVDVTYPLLKHLPFFIENFAQNIILLFGFFGNLKLYFQSLNFLLLLSQLLFLLGY